MSENKMPPIEPGSQPRPKGGIVSYLQVRDAAAASALYQKAFGAEEVARLHHPDGQRIVHCHLYINGASLMLNDPFPDQGMPHQEPQGYTLTLIVDDIDAWFARAADAGIEVVTPVATMFWGDRFGALKDSLGLHWAMNEVAKG
jgi:PhnB protein